MNEGSYEKRDIGVLEEMDLTKKGINIPLEFEFDAPTFSEFIPNKDIAYYNPLESSIHLNNELDLWFLFYHESHYIESRKPGNELTEFHGNNMVRCKGEMRPKVHKRKQISSDVYEKHVIETHSEIFVNKKREKNEKRKKGETSTEIARTIHKKSGMHCSIWSNKSQPISPQKSQTIPSIFGMFLRSHAIRDGNSSNSQQISNNSRRSDSTNVSTNTKQLAQSKKMRKEKHTSEVEIVKSRLNSIIQTQIQSGSDKLKGDIIPIKEMSSPPRNKSCSFQVSPQIVIEMNSLSRTRHQSLDLADLLDDKISGFENKQKEFERIWEKQNGMKLYMLDYQKRKEIRQLFFDQLS